MAKVYKAPVEIALPEFTTDREKWIAGEEKYLADVRRYCKENSPSRSDLVGREISHYAPHGSARYMVFNTSPLQLFHLELGDGYSVGPIWERGLRVSDIRRMIKCDRELKRLFEKGARRVREL